jgi:large subunit ribosomal protein L25
MNEITIEVHRRTASGKNANRRLRSEGLVPAVVYGAGKETVPIQIDRKRLIELLRQGGGENSVFLLQLAGAGQQRHAMIRELQVHPISRQIVHIDFQRVLMTEKVKVEVEIRLVGTAVGVKTGGGMLDFITREVEVECLPGKIPQHIDLDITAINVGQHVEAGQVVLPEGVALVTDPERVIVSVSHARVAEAAAGTPAAGEGGLLEAERAEPEVIRRGKLEEEEG